MTAPGPADGAEGAPGGPARSRRTPPGLPTLIALTAISVVSMNLFTPVLPAMAEAFGAEYGVMSLAVSGYLSLTVFVMLAAGPLSDRFGRRPVALGALGVFTFAAAMAAMAESVEWFLAWRFLQATVLAGWVVALAVIRDVAPPGQQASRIAIVTAAMAVAPMLAPMTGGALEAAFGWRATLHALWIGGAVVFALIWVDLGETVGARPASGRSLRADGAALLASPVFWSHALVLGFSSAFFHVFTTGAPFVSAAAFGMAPSEIGMWMAATPSGFLVGSLVVGRTGGRISATNFMTIGRLIAALALGAALAAALAGEVTPAIVFGTAVCAGFGNGFTIPGANAGVMAAVESAAGSAAGVAGALSVALGAAAAQLTGAVLSAGTTAEGPASLAAISFGCAAAGLASALWARSVARIP